MMFMNKTIKNLSSLSYLSQIFVICIIIFSSCLVKAQKLANNYMLWPKVVNPETRPWTWWWWHGCGAEKESIKTMLEQFHQVGLGGVNIVCVNDVVDATKPKVDFLSKEYVDLMTYAVRKARSMGMDVDISPVGGWSFGGKYIPKSRSCSVVNVTQVALDSAFTKAGNNIFYRYPNNGSINYENLQSVLAVSADGRERQLLNDKVTPIGTLQWNAPIGKGWKLYITCNVLGSSLVRASTPDWKGYVMNHLNKEDVNFYFSAFDKAFANIPQKELPRAYNNDSWEIALNWSKDFFSEFKKRRGYDLQPYIPEFLGYGSPDIVKRITCDYRETLSDLLFKVFTPTFSQWAKKHGGKIIGEVQFEPTNELDVNSLYDIPQADMGGGLDWYIQDGDYVLDQLFMRAKLPASPAHLLGKPFVSAETYTCMGGLWTPLDFVKVKTDLDFIAGINNICYHGITYTPNKSHWPGWLFYAGTQLGPFNPQWRYMDQLSKYITRNQSLLQNGKSANDVLFYFPMYDEWSLVSAPKGSSPGKADISTMRFATSNMPTTHELWKSGVDFDFITDYLLKQYITVREGSFIAPANKYKAIVIGNCKYMPVETLKRLIDYAEQGGSIIMLGAMPDSVPGLFNLKARQSVFQELIHKIVKGKQMLSNDVYISKIGKGKFVLGNDVKQCCSVAGILREKLLDDGLRCIRRKDDHSWIYFVVNLPDNQEGINNYYGTNLPEHRKEINQWVPFSVSGKSAIIYDAMTGEIGKAAFRSRGNTSEVYLQLKPNQSCIVRVFDNDVKGKGWNYSKETIAVKSFPITGTWNVTFIAGGEKIPHAEKIDKLTPWTEWKSDQSNVLQGFSGTAKYEITFDKPQINVNRFMLNLGEVCYNARVYLNGEELGTLISYPMQLELNNKLKEKDNKLEIEITNTAVNRSGDLEKRGIKWLYDIPGSYDIEYYIDKKTWRPQKSGLIGPVQLIPIEDLKID
jgi:hypothetical protein